MSARAYLGIYSPESPHESAQIVGTREGLEALYDALRRIFCGDDFLSARDHSAPTRFEAIDPNGEHHEVLVSLVDDDFFTRKNSPRAAYLNPTWCGAECGPLEVRRDE